MQVSRNGKFMVQAMYKREMEEADRAEERITGAWNYEEKELYEATRMGHLGAAEAILDTLDALNIRFEVNGNDLNIH